MTLIQVENPSYHKKSGDNSYTTPMPKGAFSQRFRSFDPKVRPGPTEPTKEALRAVHAFPPPDSEKVIVRDNLNNPSFTLAIPLETLYIHAHEKNLEPSTST
jgi:hypothetical protein